MMIVSRKVVATVAVIIFLISSATVVIAQTINVDASKLLQRVEVYFSPTSGSFVEGSTFDVPIIINTKGASINSIEARVNFDRDRLAIVSPSNGTSIIGVWIEPPRYDNTRGTASYVGVITNGITTSAGYIGTITFKALKPGRAVVSLASNSNVLLNDGLGTNTIIDTRRGEYTIVPKAPEGVVVFSDTHPFQGNWYNNNNPVVAWDKDAGVTGFSFIMDDKPSTVPDNEVDTSETKYAYTNVKDGLWYFHIKAIKNGVWGTTGHFLMRIDTAPPADFNPEVNYLLAAPILLERSLVSFFTTDNLSGVDHYEVGVIDRSQPTTESPVFVQSVSPFQVPLVKNTKMEVIVRAIDKAGNVRDASIEIDPPFLITKFIRDNLVYILLFIILLGFTMLMLHYLVGHHIVRRLRQAFKFEDNQVQGKEIKMNNQTPVTKPQTSPNTSSNTPTPQNQSNNPNV